MKKLIAVLPTGDWAEVESENDVQIVELTQRQLHTLSNDDHSQGTILQLTSDCTKENIDSILGLAVPEPILTEQALMFAIGEVLSDWNPELSASEILYEMTTGSDGAVVCEAFEDWDRDALCDFTRSLARSAQRALFNK